MAISREEALERAITYIGKPAELKELGFGAEGFVFATPDQHAIKIFTLQQRYYAEVDALARLCDCGVSEIDGLAVPVLVDHSDELMIVEMTIVQPPYLIDFAQSTLDFPRDFSDEVMEDWWNQVAEMYGDRFPRVRALWGELAERCGIYYYDIAPRNVNFGDET